MANSWIFRGPLPTIYSLAVLREWSAGVLASLLATSPIRSGTSPHPPTIIEEEEGGTTMSMPEAGRSERDGREQDDDYEQQQARVLMALMQGFCAARYRKADNIPCPIVQVPSSFPAHVLLPPWCDQSVCSRAADSVMDASAGCRRSGFGWSIWHRIMQGGWVLSGAIWVDFLLTGANLGNWMERKKTECLSFFLFSRWRTGWLIHRLS